MQKFTDMFDYKDGELYHKGTDNLATYVDSSHGYKRVFVFGKQWLSHRVIWCMFNNTLPKEIDHKDGDKTNNKIENLRPTSRSGNTANSAIRSDNKSGFRGVVWHKVTNKWQAQTMLNGKRIHMGVFESKLEAALAYNYKAKEIFGDFARFNLVF